MISAVAEAERFRRNHTKLKINERGQALKIKV